MKSDDRVQQAATRIRAQYKNSRELREYLAEVATRLIDDEQDIPAANIVEVKAVGLVLAAALNAQKAATRKSPRLGYRGQSRRKLDIASDEQLENGNSLARDGHQWPRIDKSRRG
ncbi:MAG: hypothetical protein ABI854_07220 [Betaproteobacteria bacterium]